LISYFLLSSQVLHLVGVRFQCHKTPLVLPSARDTG
jgi:hypothetical protein